MSAHPGHLLITTDAVGGVWQYTQTLALGLAERAWDVTVLCLGPPPAQAACAELTASNVDLRVVDHPLDWLAASAQEVHAAGEAIAQVAEEVGADSLHLHSPSYAAHQRFDLPVVAVSHSCLGTWWRHVREGSPPADFSWRIRLHGEGLLRADRVICPTRTFAEQTASYYGLPRIPRAIHNGRHQSARKLPQTAPLFAFTAGRLWDEAKNLATLDAVARRVQLPILAAGEAEGPNGQTCELRAVHPLGRLGAAAMDEMLRKCPIYVAPALYEPFGLGILEAAQAGCALVLGDIATLRELWDGAACFVPPRDVDAITDALEHLQANSTLRAAMAAAAHERARAYAASAFVEATAAVHVELIRGRATTPVPA